MSTKVEIDDIDLKILNALIKDARTKIKDIAKDCNISSVAVFHRIKNLKKNGVITGATLYPNFKKIGGLVVATLGIDLEAGKEEEVFDILQKQMDLIEPSPSVGKFDLCALVFAENLASLDSATHAVRNRNGVKKVTTNIWVKGALFFENVNLQPGKTEQDGQT
jgi:Lrp/AsnC family transcriptional regulator, regulator for asnA, asnC and gidA